MERLLPDQLKELWDSVERKELSAEQFDVEQKRLLTEYRSLWTNTLFLNGYEDLRTSLMGELGLYTNCDDFVEIELRCREAVKSLAQEWRDKVDVTNRQSVESFYNDSRKEIYDLIWWHTLADDLSPLSYVTALHFALREGCCSCLDFGSGVGSGAILLARHGINIALADISSPLLAFCQWRLQLRNLTGEFFDLKTCVLPDDAFDMVTAMDVFEHLVDPVQAVETLYRALKPGGFLFGRFHGEPDEDRPLHVVQDFEPTFRRLRELGFVEVWRDQWLWGHQVFRKASRT